MKIAPQTATPTATPTWRKVSLMPAAMPLRSLGTTLRATSATTGLSRPTPMPATRKPGSSVVQVSPGSIRHQQQANPRQGERATHQQARRDPGEQSARDRRGEEAHHGDRQIAQAGLERREPEIVLQVQRDVEEEREHRGRDRERG